MSKPPKFTKNILEVFTESVTTSLEHKVPRMGAALAYYTAFSLAPLLTLLFSVFSLFMKRDEATTRIQEEISNTMGAAGSSAVEMILANTATTTEISWGTVVSALVLIVAASGAFVELQDSLHTIYGVPKQKFPWLAMVKDRFLSVVMVFVVGFFFVFAILVSAFLNAVTLKQSLLNSQLEGTSIDIVNEMALFFIVTGLFATIYKILPDASVSWKTVIPGAVVGALLFIIGKSLLGWYIVYSGFSSHYGAAASFMAILFWVFYSAQILYFGAEFTSAWARQKGGPVYKSEAGKSFCS